jgi:alpha-beta hydrolase superfamily lysophospholipase
MNIGKSRSVLGRVFRISRLVGLVLAAGLVTLLAVRVYDTERGPPLEPWHTYVPHELSADEMDRADWGRYLKAEDAILDAVRTAVTQKLAPEDRVPLNRYFEGGPIYPAHFARDWNRSFELEPDGPPVGAVVLLHGLTDSPYSMRHVAEGYRARGWVAVAIRLPAHGTVPGALTDVAWEDWMAATRLAVREARGRIGPSRPLHLVGYSNGGALAVKYALDALDDPRLARADRIVLLSPMIGITAFARFAGIAGWPAILPAFAKAAWLSLVPEFNPFKYNSFPVNAARQSFRLTDALQRQIAGNARRNRLGALPPILTFQSVLDFTVSTRAVITSLYANLAANGSELVLFDLNNAARIGLLFRPASESLLARLLPAPPRRYRATVVTNAGPGSVDVVERATEAGAVAERTRDLALSYPIGVFSLSHVALPFPMNDGLYGLHPDPADDFGITLGSIATRGEVGALIVNLESIMRMSSNPFFPYMMDRIDEGIDGSAAPAVPSGATSAGTGDAGAP